MPRNFTISADVEARFWSKVQKGDGCWIWTASLDHGYGQFTVRNGTFMRAHRLAWQLANGPIPDGRVVCHRCDNPRCVNPAHLFLGLQTDNLRDMYEKQRHHKGSARSNAKMTEQTVAFVRKRYAAGDVSMQKLADEFGVSFIVINKIIHRKTWRHVV